MMDWLLQCLDLIQQIGKQTGQICSRSKGWSCRSHVRPLVLKFSGNIVAMRGELLQLLHKVDKVNVQVKGEETQQDSLHLIFVVVKNLPVNIMKWNPALGGKKDQYFEILRCMVDVLVMKPERRWHRCRQKKIKSSSRTRRLKSRYMDREDMRSRRRWCRGQV